MKEVQQKLILEKAILALFNYCVLVVSEEELDELLVGSKDESEELLLEPKKEPLIGVCGKHRNAFDGTKLLENAETLYWIFRCLKDRELLSFEELKEDRFGNRWTDLNYYINLLIIMANALGWVETIKVDDRKNNGYIVRNRLKKWDNKSNS